MKAWTNQYSSGINANNGLVFDKLNIFVAEAVDRVTKKRANTMMRTLKNRRFMGDQGTYPVGDGSKNKQAGRENEPHSYTGWYVDRDVKGTGWVIKNNHKNMIDDYNYVRNLMFGTGWPDRVKTGTHRRLVSNDGGLFSTQMPHGTRNWVKSQRKHLIRDVMIIGQLWKAGNL